MPNLLIAPPFTPHVRKHVHRGKPATKPERRLNQVEYATRRFQPEIVPSTSNHTHRGTGEKAIYELLQQELCYEPLIEPYAIKVTYTGTRNGQHGWFVPDFYIPGDNELLPGYDGIYIEVSMGADLTNKLHKIGFVAQTYGKFVVQVTKNNIDQILADPFLLDELIVTARHAQEDFVTEYGEINFDELHAALGNELPQRVKTKRKPKAKRRIQPSTRKLRNRPSRDPERRSERKALRKQARELVRLNTTSPSAFILKSQRTPDTGKRIVSNGAAVIFHGQPAKRKSSAGPKPEAARRVNTGPGLKSARKLAA